MGPEQLPVNEMLYRIWDYATCDAIAEFARPSLGKSTIWPDVLRDLDRWLAAHSAQDLKRLYLQLAALSARIATVRADVLDAARGAK